MHTSSTHLLTAAFGPALKRSTTLPPIFLLPSLTTQTKTSFSTSSPHHAPKKDGNPRRGVSALHRKGPKRISRLNELLSRIPGASVPIELLQDGLPHTDERFLTQAKKRAALNAAIAEALPKPVLDPAQRSAVEVDADHGLWDFFNEGRTALSTPLELSQHGRAWTVAELRNKDWEDLWRLWWVCLKERNRAESFRMEKSRIGGHMYGDYEVDARFDTVEKTMAAIRHTLTERWYSWENARQAAMEDEEVDLYADSEKGGQAYLPREVEVGEVVESEAPTGDPNYFPPPASPGRTEVRV